MLQRVSPCDYVACLGLRCIPLFSGDEYRRPRRNWRFGLFSSEPPRRQLPESRSGVEFCVKVTVACAVCVSRHVLFVVLEAKLPREHRVNGALHAMREHERGRVVSEAVRQHSEARCAGQLMIITVCT